MCAKYVDEVGHDQLDVELMQLQLIVIRVGVVGATVLAPTDLSMKLSRGPAYAGAKVEMSLMINEPIECCVSYQDCKLAAQIARALRDESVPGAGAEQRASIDHTGAAAALLNDEPSAEDQSDDQSKEHTQLSFAVQVSLPPPPTPKPAWHQLSFCLCMRPRSGRSCC